LQRASGRYVYFATSDDTMSESCLEKMVAEMDAHPDCGLCHCNLSVIDEAGNPAAFAKPWNQYDGVSYFGDLIHKKHIRHAPHDGLLAIMLESVYLSITQVLIRRSLFERVGFFESKWGPFSDYAWHIRAGLLTNTVHIPEVLATWRRHPSQTSQYDKYLAGHASGMMLQMVREAMGEALAKNPELKKYLSYSRLTIPLRQCAVDARLKSAHGGRQKFNAWRHSLIRDPYATIRQFFLPSGGQDRIVFARWGALRSRCQACV
jgi:GT2 family glycosyltransferase